MKRLNGHDALLMIASVALLGGLRLKHEQQPDESSSSAHVEVRSDQKREVGV